MIFVSGHLATVLGRKTTEANMDFVFHRRSFLSVLTVVGIAVVIFPVSAIAQTGWSGSLHDGREIVADPRSNKVVIGSGKAHGQPLWDGVHRLSDGSTVTIRAGVMVPNASSSSPSASANPQASLTVAPLPRPSNTAGGPQTAHCDQLVLKTCGMRQDCRSLESCRLATQLRQLRHQPVSASTDNRHWAEGQCLKALQDEAAYPPCTFEPLLPETACRRLVGHVCADRIRCSQAPLCRMARGLQQREQSARVNGANEALAAIRRQCLDVMCSHAFFPPCR
jgi:hypothetical protein